MDNIYKMISRQRGLRCDVTFRFNYFHQSCLIDSILDLEVNNSLQLSQRKKFLLFCLNKGLLNFDLSEHVPCKFLKCHFNYLPKATPQPKQNRLILIIKMFEMTSPKSLRDFRPYPTAQKKPFQPCYVFSNGSPSFWTHVA